MNARLVCAAATALLSTAAQAASWSFMEAFPLNPGPVESGKTPRQFLMNIFNDQYLCERTGPAQRPQATPAPTPASVPVQAFCDGSSRIVVKRENKVMVGDEFGWSSDCKRALNEFREYEGCFCGAQNTIRCLTRDLSLLSLGGGFSLRSECERSLKDLSKQGVDVKFRQ